MPGGVLNQADNSKRSLERKKTHDYLNKCCFTDYFESIEHPSENTEKFGRYGISGPGRVGGISSVKVRRDKIAPEIASEDACHPENTWGPSADRSRATCVPKKSLSSLGATRAPLDTASARPIPRRILGPMPALAALKASPYAGATCEPAWAGPGAKRGVATALEAAPGPRLGREARRAIAAGAAHRTPSSGLARGIACPLRPGLTGTRKRKRRRGPSARRSTPTAS